MLGHISMDKYVPARNRAVTLENVNFTVVGDAYGIITNGQDENERVVLKNSILNVLDGYGIYFPASGSVTIEDSVINAKYFGVQMCSGSLEVMGDKTAITTTGEPQEKTESDGPIADGAAISVVNRSYPGGIPTMNVTGGTFNSDHVNAVKAYTFSNDNKTEENWENAKEFVSISGGTFSNPESIKGYLDTGCALDANGTVVPAGNSVASIGSKGYATLAEAIKAAEKGDTIKLLNSVTIDTWTQVWYTKDLTIDGNNKTITVGKVESNGNGNYLFYGAENLNVSNLTVNLPEKGSGFDMLSGTLENVTVNGGTYAVVTGVAPEGQRVEIKNCTFTGQTGMAIYTEENGKAAGTVIEGCTFDSDKAVILRNNEQFTNNTVKGSAGVTIDSSATATVTGNTFTESSRLKVYNTDSTIEKNKLLGNVVLDGSVPADSKVSLNKNYWGENRTPAQVLGEDAKKVDGGNTNYYEAETMRPEDLNTYAPSSGGSSSSSYTVNVEDSKNGTVTASHKSASKNTTVTVTVKADKGYELDELTVTDKNGKELKLTDKGNGKYTFAMPASKVDVKATFAEIVEKPTYSDVSASAWYAKAVAYVTEKGMMEGDSGKFMPLDKLTRSQMAQVLFNLEGKKSVNYALTFGDMNGTEWYAEAVRWAASEQIVNGYDNGNFGPNDPITREQLVTVLYRYAQYKGLDTATTEENLTSFADAAQVSGYAVSAMNWAVGAGVINGTDSGLAPKATATRAEVAQILMNFDQKF